MVTNADHIENGNSFRDADNQFDSCVARFLNCGSRARGRNINHGDVCSGSFFSLFHRGKNRQTFPYLARFTRIHAAHKAVFAKSVLSAQTCMELSGFPGHTLSNHTGIFINQNTHRLLPRLFYCKFCCLAE